MPKDYCPIIFTHQAMGQSEQLVQCKGEKCAWWDETLKACVIMNLHQLRKKIDELQPS